MSYGQAAGPQPGRAGRRSRRLGRRADGRRPEQVAGPVGALHRAGRGTLRRLRERRRYDIARIWVAFSQECQQ